MFRQPEPPSKQESLKNGVAWATSCDVKQGKLLLPHSDIAQKRTKFSMYGECDTFRSFGKLSHNPFDICASRIRIEKST